jgi:predicted cupin superfamily sugar epimerase
MTADEVKKILGLQLHPREGGWFVRTWESEEFVAASCFEDGRYDGARRTSTAIYYLLEPGTFSEMHRLQSDEVFHHYMGGAVEMLQLFADGSSQRVVIGKDLEAGERPREQGSRHKRGGRCWVARSARGSSSRITKTPARRT